MTDACNTFTEEGSEVCSAVSKELSWQSLCRRTSAQSTCPAYLAKVRGVRLSASLMSMSAEYCGSRGRRKWDVRVASVLGTFVRVVQLFIVV